VNWLTQIVGTLCIVAFAALVGLVVYGVLHKVMGLRLTQEEEFEGADLSIHRIKSTPEQEASW
jgi:ammonium transporter, Amt family